MDEDFGIPAADEMNDEFMDDIEGGPVTLKVGEEKEIGNQGLKKKLLKDGDGWETPESGDEVEGQVIKGWDLGIKTMKKGENSLFTIRADLAYGEAGSPLTIPPDATLQFDVELLSWVSVKDICKDGGIFKKIIKEGEKWENHKDLDEVLGDRYLKPWIIPEPEVTFTARSREDECLILASDRLWDVISNEEACEVARRRILIWHKKNGGNTTVEREQNGVDPVAQAAADYLSMLAQHKGSKDNISVIVVDLKPQRRFKTKT